MPLPFYDDHTKEKCTHCRKVESRADVKQILTNTASAATGLNPGTLSREEQKYQDIGSILEEV
jgi:hypothetical protein